MKKIKTDEPQLWHSRNYESIHNNLIQTHTGEHDKRWRRKFIIWRNACCNDWTSKAQDWTNLRLLVGVQATSQIVIWQWGSKPFGKLKFVLNWLVTLNREILRRNRSKNISFIVDNRSASIAYEIKLLKMSGQTFKFATDRKITIYDLQKMRYAKCELGWTRRSVIYSVELDSPPQLNIFFQRWKSK